jgi:hypothetical protein
MGFGLRSGLTGLVLGASVLVGCGSVEVTDPERAAGFALYGMSHGNYGPNQDPQATAAARQLGRDMMRSSSRRNVEQNVTVNTGQSARTQPPAANLPKKFMWDDVARKGLVFYLWVDNGDGKMDFRTDSFVERRDFVDGDWVFVMSSAPPFVGRRVILENQYAGNITEMDQLRVKVAESPEEIQYMRKNDIKHKVSFCGPIPIGQTLEWGNAGPGKTSTYTFRSYTQEGKEIGATEITIRSK